MTSHDRVILGIDPGSNITGFGILKVVKGKPEMISNGIIRLDSDEDHFIRLKKIFEETLQLIETYQPNEFAVEAPFYGNNVQSMLKLGRAQGAAITAALTQGLTIHEYSPRKVKMAITGNGNSSKEQVAAMLKNMLKIKEDFKNLDASDGLAVAFCHSLQNSQFAGGEKYNGWQDFLKKNPAAAKNK